MTLTSTRGARSSRGARIAALEHAQELHLPGERQIADRRGIACRRARPRAADASGRAVTRPLFRADSSSDERPWMAPRSLYDGFWRRTEFA